MNWKLAFTLVALGCSALAAPGCAADADPMDDADAEEAASSEAEISAASKKLAGAYHHSGGAMRPPTFQGLVLGADGSFFADVDTGIRCITTPCPSHARLEGKFSATKSYLRLTAKQAGGEGASFYGRYKYAVGKDGALSLSRAGESYRGWSNDLSKENSYCGQPDDCWSQNLIHPMCMGGWVCGGGINNQSSNQCGWKCGSFPPPPADIVPADAQKIIAQSSGGGFTPPPPAGSTCAIGAQKYELDLTTREVAYETCKFVDWQTPLTKQTGSKTLTVAEVAAVVAAGNAMEITTEDICGADKPMLTVSVDTKIYKDSFYACMGNGTYVNDIGGVFQAFRDAVGQ
jgi:hypothetical protein